MDATVRQYLELYAEPDAALAERVGATYQHVLVVPACREAPGFHQGYLAAARSAPGRVLCVVIVNGADDAPVAVHRQNGVLLESLTGSARRTLPSEAVWRREDDFDLFVVDRASEGRRLPPKQGVGLARKIGTDLALALFASGAVRDSNLYGSDADVELPAEYFRAGADVEPSATALLFPFLHAPSGEVELDRATELYEILMRYYVAGLRHASSPYAYHSVGSACVPRAVAYARARGFPKRLGGEDFHLLSKLAKLGPLARVDSNPIRIQTRRSDRVAFGTGPAVARVEAREQAGLEFTLHHPGAFEALRALLVALRSYAASPHDSAPEEFIAGAASMGEAGQKYVAEAGLYAELERVRRECRTEARRIRRLGTWFDALRTLRFVRAVDATLPELGWPRALTLAPFVPSEPQNLSVQAALRGFRSRERHAPPRVGPTLFGA
ncbi:MAG TPA: hypothetical protein VF989_00100 [Polyangiaceae bacterium]